jgi:hypothetical protein
MRGGESPDKIVSPLVSDGIDDAAVSVAVQISVVDAGLLGVCDTHPQQIGEGIFLSILNPIRIFLS